MTIRPKLKADAPDDPDSRNDVWSNAPALKSTTIPAAKTGSNENTPQVPAWLANRDQTGRAANMNGREPLAAPGDEAGGGAGRDWQYDWDAPLSRGTVPEKPRRRFFLPRGAVGAPTGRGRLVARRLIISAACLAIVAAIGGGVVLFSGHPALQSVATATQVEKKKAPVIAGNKAVKPQETKQLVKTAEAGAAKAPAGVNETQKVGALPIRSAAAKLPSPDSARWASNVVSPSKALSGALAGKPAPTTRSIAAYAPANGDAKPGPDVKAAPEARAAPEVKSASLTPAPKADDARTSSIPDEGNAAEKARTTMEDVAHSGAKPISTGGSRAVVTTAVNLRVGRDNRSHVLTVVPAGASVELFGCDQWCKIAYDGHEGFVYKEFVRHSGHVPAVARSRHEKAAGKVASSGSENNKLIGGAVVDAGSTKAAVTSEPAPAAAAPKPAQPAAAEPPTMRNDSR